MVRSPPTAPLSNLHDHPQSIKGSQWHDKPTENSEQQNVSIKTDPLRSTPSTHRSWSLNNLSLRNCRAIHRSSAKFPSIMTVAGLVTCGATNWLRQLRTNLNVVSAHATGLIRFKCLRTSESVDVCTLRLWPMAPPAAARPRQHREQQRMALSTRAEQPPRSSRPR